MSATVLLHGAWGAPADWDDAVAAAGTGPGRRPDLSDISSCIESVEVDDVWSHAIEHLVGSLPTGGLVLGGYSLGARLALGLALHPAVAPRLKGLLLVAGTAGLEDAAQRAARRLLDDERAAWQARDPRAFLEAFWGLPLFAGLRSHPRRANLLDERAARAAVAPARLARLMRGLSVGRMPSLWRAIEGVTAPTIVVSGAVDTEFVKNGRRLSAAIADSQHVVVEGAGHALLLEAPSAVGGALARLAGECS